MKRARTARALVLALGMAGALTACGEDSTDKSADPSPTTATSSSAAPTTEAATATTPAPTTPAAPSAPVLGPDGLGALTLGMDADQAEATGVVKPFADSPYGGCATSRLTGATDDPTPTDGERTPGTVWLNSDLGIAAIDAYPGVETPEGIGIGDPLSAVDAAYPGWDYSDHLMRGAAVVPGNDEAVYRIAVDRSDTVTEVTLQFLNQGCYE